jgi:malate dehydrogenase (oxaloacetate-decarboxylating)(NADP+)
MFTLLGDPLHNKGTAFTEEERARLGIEGLLPPRVESIEEQAERVLENVRARADALERYELLAEVQAENATLFHRVLVDHLQDMLPLVYTPTVGEACLAWSRIYSRPRGLYLSARHRGRMAQVLRNWPQRDVGVIVVTDGGRILGLGDLGANGMGIPVGKLALYTACAGVPPAACLPVTLDVGTGNETLRNDPRYLGSREPRLAGAAWDALADEFVAAAHAVFPDAVVQFEDFNNACAFALLERWRERLCCFNDDIQGTGAMALAGLYAAGRITGKKLSEQRMLFVGAGEACLGIGGAVQAAMRREGPSLDEARERCLFFDSRGAVLAGRSDLAPQKRRFAQARAPLADLAAAIEAFRPTALVGACAQPGIFTRPLLEAMARLNERPIVFALSNPTAKAECSAEQAYAWTGGRALFAAGSPFAPVRFEGHLLCPGQGNNAHIFPGVGQGLLVSGARRATDEMFLAAAQALAAQVSAADLDAGRVFPAAGRMREVALEVAAAVARCAYEQDLASKPRPADLRAATAAAMYRPEYPSDWPAAPRLTSASDGRGAALTVLVADWAARNPRVRRVWTCESHVEGALALALELEPVADSEETATVWLAHCEEWRGALARRLRRAVELEWIDRDEASAPNQPGTGEVRTLVYERLS